MHKKILILGGGISGNSAASLLKSHGADVYLCDRNKPDPLPDAYSGFISETSPANIQLDLIIKSPGISPTHPVLKTATIPVISEIDLGRLFYKGKLIGITGTDGKSTTTALTAHLLGKSFKTAMGGNIGTPFTALCTGDYEVIVLELSSYQLEDSGNLDIDIAAILNFAPDHLERHSTFENYIRAKARILNRSGQQILVTSEKTAKMLDTAEYTGKLLLTGGGSCDAGIDYSQRTITTVNKVYHAGNFSLQGNHNLENLATAILVAESAGCPPERIQELIPEFKGLRHRFETVGKYGKTEFINDSKSTNLHSLMSWISDYPENKKVILILGGRNKDKDISELANILKKKNATVFLFGEAVRDWRQQLEFLDRKLVVCGNLDEIFHTLTGSAIWTEADNVVFSPACASFDQYKNFEERGEHFVRLVQEITHSIMP